MSSMLSKVPVDTISKVTSIQIDDQKDGQTGTTKGCSTHFTLEQFDWIRHLYE